MNIRSYTSRATIVALVAMASQTSWAQSARSIALKEQDPNGFILTLTAVLVVFSSLLMLVVVFRSIGKFMLYLNERSKQKELKSQTEYKPNTHSAKSTPTNEELVAIGLALDSELGVCRDEVIAAIAMALRAELEQQHDTESYVLTIKHRPTQWNARAEGIRKFNY